MYSRYLHVTAKETLSTTKQTKTANTHTHTHTKAHLYAVLRLFDGSDLHGILSHVVISIMLVSFYKCIHTPLFK